MKKENKKKKIVCKHEWAVSIWQKMWKYSKGFFSYRVGEYLEARQLYCIKCLELKYL